jgi:ribosomal protein S18 acetylase RimI-like enzyme
MDEPMRMAEPKDYDAIAAVADDWWGRTVLGALPRVFLQLFYRTSLVVDGASGPDAFLIGILSPSDSEQAYIHFVGVAPHARERGLGRQLYEEFFRMARADGRTSRATIAIPSTPAGASATRA